MPVAVVRMVLVLASIGVSMVADEALAGGVRINPLSVEINEGQSRVAAPGDRVSLSFVADMFAFGSDQREYLVFSVVPERQRLTDLGRLDADTWKLYAYAVDPPPKQSNFSGQRLRHTVQLVAPSAPGKYKIVYNKYPFFGAAYLADPGSTVEPTGGVRKVFSDHFMQYRNEFGEVGRFVVGAAPSVAAITPPKLYLQVNGATPAIKPIKTGAVEQPLMFTWNVEGDFRLPKKNLSYRYQMMMDGDDWTEWSASTAKAFFFLPRGNHEFRVQAKYEGPEGAVSSAVARYNFFLSEPFVARPSKEALSKPATLGNIQRLPTPDVNKVYGGSRALLFGIYGFDDTTSFLQLPQDRIERDISTLKEALVRNGFEVKALVRRSITTQDVRDAIDDFIKSSRNNERLFIYFSTHGFADPNKPANGYIATTDCKARSANATCIALTSFREQLNEAIERDALQVVVAVDSCFSGLGVIVKSIPEPNLAELGRRKGIHMLTAGMEHQKAQIDDALQMSTFTHYLAKGLDGQADLFKTGVISLTQLFLYVQFEVANRTNASQIPMMGRVFGSGEMLFRSPIPKQAAQ